MIAEPVTVPTARGPAAVRVHRPEGTHEGTPRPMPRGTLLLGHGAGGPLGSWPKDLQSALTATTLGWTVVLVEQPWRVAGRKVATLPPTLDAAWSDIVTGLDREPLPRPLVYGGRSAGARVACRTSPGEAAAGLPRADAVLCLAFPLHPPGRPDRSRAGELATPLHLGIPTLVVQGRADPFGSPGEVREALASEAADQGPLTLVEVAGSHSPARDQALVTHAVHSWLDRLG